MSDRDNQDQINTKPLDALFKALKENKLVVRVGVLGGKNARSGGGGSNASIGAVHEFGSTEVPQRSFLRMPLADQLPKEMEQIGLFDEKDINQIIKDISLQKFANKIGALAVRTVLKAFDTGGFGKWAPLSLATLEHKKVKQILVETHQLRDSITYDVKKSK